MSTYTIHRAAGWHGEPSDPIIETTDDRAYAALRAGERVDIRIPGGSNPHDAYALDEDGERVDPVESFRCDDCGELRPWGESGPCGAVDGVVLDEPGGREPHLVTWVCEDCAEEMESDS